MKRGRRNLLILAGCVLVVVVARLVWPGEREPEYQGKKLSEWLRAFELSARAPDESEMVVRQVAAAGTAVEIIGTNAVPWLVRWIAYERPPWQRRTWVAIAAAQVPVSSFERWLWKREALAQDSIQAFEILGPAAAPAAPGLAKLARDDQEPGGRDRAIDALGYLGRSGFKLLLALMEERQTASDFVGASRCAVRILTMDLEDDEVAAAVPSLFLDIGWRGDSKAGRDGAYNLWSLARSPSFVPAVTNCLTHTNPIIRQMALLHLARLSKADFAIDAMRSALSDPATSVRAEATNALLKIAPEVLTNGVAR